MSAAPAPLPENTGLTFLGERSWPAAGITDRQAATLTAAPNPTGRQNRDVLREYLAVSPNGRPRVRWQIDFPLHFTEQEASLYERPFALLRRKTGAKADRWWINPHADAALRRSLARLDRFLAAPCSAKQPHWSWIETGGLPDASLLVVARDDDFSHAVLQSRFFAAWWQAHYSSPAPARAVSSFPFPWPPGTPLGSLTGAQQDQRLTTARAARNGDAEQIDSAVATAYGWPRDLTTSELLARLRDLHRRRAGM
jgi:hypothetical protein